MQNTPEKLCALFDEDYERYDAFLELRRQISNVHKIWTKRFLGELQRLFAINTGDNNIRWRWRHWPGEQLGFTFYLEEYGEDSLSLYLNGPSWSYWGGDTSNAVELKRLMKTDEYRPLFEEGLNVQFNKDWEMSARREEGVWNFDGNIVGSFENRSDEFIWFAGNESAKIAIEVKNKLHRISSNPHLLNLFQKLHLDTRKT